LAQADAPPNVLVILADDQGWGDLSSTGNKDVSTPNIDSLEHDGASFESFYACPVCAPTRAEFLTGRYHPRTGVHGVTRGAERMNLDERTIAESFRAAGYATGCFGKWHNGMQYPYHPRARGFDTFVGFCSGHWGDSYDPELERDGEYFKAEGYITDVFTEEAISFIEKNKDRPFFCYVPLCTPHAPMQVPDMYWDRFKDKKLVMAHPQIDDHTRAALAMVEHIDDNVGRLLAKLDALGLAKNTIVIFFSDNGPNGRRWNGGMRGTKGSVDEGGVRVPCAIRWPDKIRPRKASFLAAAIDLYPTLLELAGIRRVGDLPLDGVSLAPFLRPAGKIDDPAAGGPPAAPRSALDRLVFSNQKGRVSVRSPTYRLDERGRLYDMGADPGQTRDVRGDHPDEAKRLQDAVAAWREDVGLDGTHDERPYVVGHADWPVTELPARDALTRGGIGRSSRYPNCSYFLNWKATDDAITWDIEVLSAGRYEAIVYYACPQADVGSTVELRFGDARTSGTVNEAHDPPLEGEKENRVQTGESFLKDFKPLSLGVITLPAGRGELSLHAIEIPGSQVMEFRRLWNKSAAAQCGWLVAPAR
jgi:arylsulfatase A-like enzyme